jgi:hypothetical protein
MSPDLGEQNLTLLEAGKKAAAKAALDALEHGEKELQIEATTAGDVEASIHAPVKGFTVSAFVKAPIRTLKQAVAGVRLSRKF